MKTNIALVRKVSSMLLMGALLELGMGVNGCTTGWKVQQCGTQYDGSNISCGLSSEEPGSRDLTTDIARSEAASLQKQAKNYAEKFALSYENGMRIARTISDFNSIKSRDQKDVEDFGRRLYGVDPQRIVAAVAQAQLGNQSELQQLVGEAAANFDTTPENMKVIVKSIHGKMLKAQGIDLD